MSLRARLLIALLAVGIVPSIIIALLAVFQLNLAMAPWFRPGIDRALESALQVTQSSIARFESTVLSRSADWASTWPAGTLTPEQRAHWAGELEATSLDFVQSYALADTGWVLDQQVLPAGILLAETIDLAAEIDSALAGSPLMHSYRGALAAAANLPSGGALVAGIRLNPDFFSEVRRVVDGVTFYGRSTVYGPLERMGHWLIVAIVIVLVGGLAAVIANAIARETSRPLRELAAATDRVAASDFSVRVVPRGARELQRLGGSFNTMIIRLREAQAAIREAERESAWRDAARKLAHEFKGILSPLKLALQRFETRIDALPAEQRETTARSLGRALGGVEALERLSSQFHQYARMPEPNFEPLDVAEIVRSAAEQAPDARIIASEPSIIEADRILLSRAVHNLIVNAVEASPPGVPVEVAIRTEGPNTIIDVLDRGSGLPGDLLPRLFDPYVSNKKRGSGLGLALVRDIARLHDGTITLDNRDGGGARARLTLPRKEPAGRRSAPSGG